MAWDRARCAPLKVESGGGDLVPMEFWDKLDRAKTGWYYDSDSATVYINLKYNPEGIKTVVENRWQSLVSF